ncbi:MAG: hypothetical protein L0I94_08420 [Yaniella sp.]|nr:hypothetical protein [Yaniella sp.]
MSTQEEIAAAQALLEDTGAEIRIPHSSTVRRRHQKKNRAVAVISRSGRAYRQEDGRVYGEVDSANQRQSDAGPWPANVAIRRDCLPITIAVGGQVRRVYEVHDWYRNGKKWSANLGREINNEILDRVYPDFPYRIGDDCPTRRGGAYRPEYY